MQQASFYSSYGSDAPGGDDLRTTISIPDRLYSEAKTLAGSRPFSDFASEAIQARILQLQRESLAREMEAGYRAEAQSLSLHPDWVEVETEGL
jgi:hypothetical protein